MSSRVEQAKGIGIRAWSLIGCVVVFMLTIYALGLVWSAVELLIVGLVLGFVCSPLTNGLEDRGVPRALAALLALAIVLLVVSLAFVVLVPSLMSQLTSVLQRVPSYVSQVRQWINEFWAAYGNSRTADAQQIMDQVVAALSTVGTKAASELAEKLSNGIMTNIMGLANGAMTLFLGMVLAYWLAKDYPTIVREAAVIAGPEHERSLYVLLAVLTRSVGGYMRAMTITSLVNGVLAGVVLALLGNPYAGLLGVAAGLLHFVPVVGPIISAALAVVLSLFASPVMALEALVVFVIAQNVTDNVLSPMVMQSTVNVHPVLTLVGITVGSALGGILGMVCAIPLTAALSGVFVYYFEEGSGRQLVSFDGAFFKGQPFHNEDGSIDPVFDALGDEDFFRKTRLVGPDFKEDAIPDEHPSPRERSLIGRVTAAAKRAAHRGADSDHDGEV